MQKERQESSRGGNELIPQEIGKIEDPEKFGSGGIA
jgi:hypothetical protein